MWKDSLKKNIVSIDKLISFLKLDKKIQKNIYTPPSFNLNIPYNLAKKIKKNTLEDPIFKQFVPLKKEQIIKKGFSLAPVKDSAFQHDFLIKKYKNRALLISSDKCAMNCRFCFRKNFNYHIKDKTFFSEINQIEKDKSLTEIILSGGDPLLLDNNEISNILSQIENISHIKRIRFHTRALIALPERIDKELLSIFKSCKKQILIVIHVNHKQELDNKFFKAMVKLQKLKIPILSQTVLLKDINDNVPALFDLFESLSNNGIIPYYLHQLDKIQGASHFEVSIKKGKELIKNLKKLTSGYNIPAYVQEIPFKSSKTQIY